MCGKVLEETEVAGYKVRIINNLNDQLISFRLFLFD